MNGGDWCGGGRGGWCRFDKLFGNVRAKWVFFIIIVMVIRWIRQVIVYVSGMRAVTLVVSYKIENEALG